MPGPGEDDTARAKAQWRKERSAQYAKAMGAAKTAEDMKALRTQYEREVAQQFGLGSNLPGMGTDI